MVSWLSGILPRTSPRAAVAVSSLRYSRSLPRLQHLRSEGRTSLWHLHSRLRIPVRLSLHSQVNARHLHFSLKHSEIGADLDFRKGKGYLCAVTCPQSLATGSLLTLCNFFVKIMILPIFTKNEKVHSLNVKKF